MIAGIGIDCVGVCSGTVVVVGCCVVIVGIGCCIAFVVDVGGVVVDFEGKTNHMVLVGIDERDIHLLQE